MYFATLCGYYLMYLLAMKLVVGQDMMDPRIVGGTTVNISAIPYIVQILLDNCFICGGTLVKSNCVVTAGHCAADTREDQLTVVGGASKLSEPGVTRKVLRIMVHPNYNSQTLDYDVAVVKLTEPILGANIAPIALNADRLPAGTIGRVSGWGKTSENDVAASDDLRTVLVSIISRQTCCDEYENVSKITATMFCAASADFTKDSCAGDSGGPFVCNQKLCGIVSWGNGCARMNFAGVYTLIRAVLSFIQLSCL